MSDDRELLEMAAKACGIRLDYRRGSDAYYFDDPFSGREEWHPLTRRSQALWLMAKLGIQASVCRDFQAEASDENETTCAVEPCQNATEDESVRCLCRAIVRVSAEIGKGMP